MPDNQILKYLFVKKYISRKEAQWLDMLSDFVLFPITLQKGKFHVLGDTLSRSNDFEDQVFKSCTRIRSLRRKTPLGRLKTRTSERNSEAARNISKDVCIIRKKNQEQRAFDKAQDIKAFGSKIGKYCGRFHCWYTSNKKRLRFYNDFRRSIFKSFPLCYMYTYRY